MELKKRNFLFKSIIIFIIMFLILYILEVKLKCLSNTVNAKDNYIKNVYLYHPFVDYDSDFEPSIELYSKKDEINSFINGKLLLFQNNKINPYNQNTNNTILSIVDDKGNNYYYLKNVNIERKIENISKNSKFIPLNNKFTLFVKKGDLFINPLKIFNVNYYSKVNIVNIYFLNKDNIPVSFRSSYKSNYLKFALYTYSKIYTPFYIKTFNISNIDVIIDNKRIFSQKLEKFDKKMYLLLKTMFLKKYIVALPPIYVPNGEHFLTVEVSDFKGNIKKFTKKFYVKSN